MPTYIVEAKITGTGIALVKARDRDHLDEMLEAGEVKFGVEECEIETDPAKGTFLMIKKARAT